MNTKKLLNILSLVFNLEVIADNNKCVAKYKKYSI